MVEDQLFDGFLLSVIGGFVAARIFYVILHFGDFGWSVVTWINIFSHGGLSLPFGVIAALFFLVRFSQAKNWETFGVLDMWMPGLFLAASIHQFGVFFQGQSAVLRTPFFSLPVALLVGVLLLGGSRYVYWLESRYRTFAWYKSNQDVAKTGFITAVGLIFLGIIFLFASLASVSESLGVDSVVKIAVFVIGVIVGLALLVKRSGSLTMNKKKK